MWNIKSDAYELINKAETESQRTVRGRGSGREWGRNGLEAWG